MARPNKAGLDYFSLDTDMDQEDKIAYIESKHGLIAFGLIIRLLMRIYRGGYFIAWTEREQYLFCKNINVDITTTQTIVNECINEGLFNKKLYEQYSILTSHGIQKRYVSSCDRRKKVFLFKEYFLLNPSQDDLDFSKIALTSINGDNNLVNADITLTETIDNANIALAETPQSKVKESKVNKSKVNHSRAREDGSPVDNFSEEGEGDGVPSSDGNPDFMQFWNEYPRKQGMSKAKEAWDKSIAAGAKPAILVAAAVKYRAKVKAEGTEIYFAKMPHTFLQEHIPFEARCPTCEHYSNCQGKGSWIAVVSGKDNYPETTTHVCPYKGSG